MKIRFIAVVEADDDTKHQYDLPTVEKVPECLRLLRMRTGLSQKAVADFIGVRKQAVQGWEAGQALPSAEHLAMVLHFLTKNAIAVEDDAPAKPPPVATEPEPPPLVPKVTIKTPAGLKKPKLDVHQQIDDIFGSLQPLANE